ncbi:hypothetical protein DAEQUDRAFT_726786 [Daedalea quercina L-15889]|uniref:Uncharacterized protein n=1 Tax=Daedalea quercina L-15889 TaxID=1314783 RepID=A0A165QHI1_9APHY|nr:hypothetical protein DAEQUDRAFT_726786 [Daedalea quercina L-15889]
MKLSPSLVLLAVTLSSQASLWGHSSSSTARPPAYTSWTPSELIAWLDSRNIPIPTTTPGPSAKQLRSLVSSNWETASHTAASWGAAQTDWAGDQAGQAQAAFWNYYGHFKQDAFETWDESRLREFLLEQGVVEPSGTREQLALLAKQKWAQASSSASAYSNSASSLAGQASQSASSAGASASSLGSSVSAKASTVVYGDKWHQASKSVGNAASSATAHVEQALDDSKDYVYSTWDDNALRTYLESKGVIETKQQATRNQLLQWMRDTYASAANPIWEAWSDSYIHQWLLKHGIVKPEAQKKREEYLALMKNYYYGPQETVWSSWDDSQMKEWLVEHGVIKSNVQVKREKLEKLLADNYAHTQDTLWSAWDDSDMRAWLIEHGYIRSDAQKTRDELVKLMQNKHTEYNARTTPYLVWPDARLRAYLREHGLSEEAVPTSRPGLLQEVRIRYVQSQGRAEAIIGKVKGVLHGATEAAEEQIGKVIEKLTGGAETAKENVGENVEAGGEKVKTAGQKLQKTEL